VTTWNEIPYDENATPETKAQEFDLQHRENGGESPQVDNNPYSKSNFNADRRSK
jgi:hypothetical protein